MLGTLISKAYLEARFCWNNLDLVYCSITWLTMQIISHSYFTYRCEFSYCNVGSLLWKARRLLRHPLVSHIWRQHGICAMAEVARKEILCPAVDFTHMKHTSPCQKSCRKLTKLADCQIGSLCLIFVPSLYKCSSHSWNYFWRELFNFLRGR